jgi:hypothetical protein
MVNFVFYVLSRLITIIFFPRRSGKSILQFSQTVGPNFSKTLKFEENGGILSEDGRNGFPIVPESRG